MDPFAPRIIELAPGSALTRTNDRHSFWGERDEPSRRTRTLEQIAKHEAKLLRRRRRWAVGLICNPCITKAQVEKHLGYA